MSATQLALEGELSIFTVALVKERLLAALNGADAVEVDLSRINEIDSAGVQLLVAAKTEAQAQGKNLGLVHHAPVVLEILDLCDLSGYFGDPVLISSRR